MRIVEIWERVPKGAFIDERKGKFVEVGNIECKFKRWVIYTTVPARERCFLYL